MQAIANIIYQCFCIPCILWRYFKKLHWSCSSFLLLLTGCSAKLTFCKSNPCQNGGTCRVGWETFLCDCPLGYGGKDCSNGERCWFYSLAYCSMLLSQTFLVTNETVAKIIGTFCLMHVMMRVVMLYKMQPNDCQLNWPLFVCSNYTNGSLICKLFTGANCLR